MIAAKLGTNLTSGIPGDAGDLDRRREQFGENRFPEPLLHSWYHFFFESLKDLILIILVVAAVVSMTVGGIEDPGHGWMDGLAILVSPRMCCGNGASAVRAVRALHPPLRNRV